MTRTERADAGPHARGRDAVAPPDRDREHEAPPEAVRHDEE